MKKIVPIIVLVLLIIAGVLFWQRQHASGVPVQNDYGSKIVYTTETDGDQTSFREDCAKRGGQFNACGSPCAADADFCIQVCALTCEGL
ncbi:MAG: hypothetical protein KW806_00010 [Candidatus Yanofskybacteria bacterium]|nr:hypothetical protein [Candidatus Yanofskybacteria bacterium]